MLFNTPESDNWRPACSIAMLRLRAQVLQKIRGFFAEKGVLEVETPVLCAAVGTDPNLAFFTTQYQWLPKATTLYLQTSPEFAMKRLLASGSGSIYQICKAFRNGESGRYHNPEFTLLEWYRVGFDLTQLMDEVVELLNELFVGQLTKAVKISYPTLFKNYTDLDCLTFDIQAYRAFANNHPRLLDAQAICGEVHGQWLDFMFSQCIQPFLTGDELYLVHDYPACLSSLARLNANNPLLTDRVEVFVNGVELGNGYYELTDAAEQAQRFSAELAVRQAQQLPMIGKDERLLAALNAGLPDCAGIALGLDRILMLLAKSGSIDETIAFPVHKA